jgi:hypothetical protein
MWRRQGANVARLQFKSRYSLQACEEKNTRFLCEKKLQKNSASGYNIITRVPCQLFPPFKCYSPRLYYLLSTTLTCTGWSLDKRTPPLKSRVWTRGHAEVATLTTNYESSYQSFVFFIGVANRFLSKMSNGTTKKSDWNAYENTDFVSNVLLYLLPCILTTDGITARSRPAFEPRIKCH